MQSPTRAQLQRGRRAESVRGGAQAAPLFDPAAFSTEPRHEARQHDEPRRAEAAVRTPDSSSSGSLRLSASASTSSLSSICSGTSTGDEGEEEDRRDEEEDRERKRCLDLLDQLQLEVSRLNAADAPALLLRKDSSCGGKSIPGLIAPEMASTPSTPTRWRTVNYTSSEPSAAPARTRTPSPATRIQRSPRIQRRTSRRPSCPQSDVVDLDLDSILAAYERDGVLPSLESEPELAPDNAAGRERQSTFPLHPVPACSTVRPGLDELEHRSSSPTPSTSSASALSVLDERYPHRRVAPFPTVPRPKSSGSLRSVAHSQRGGLHAFDAPPVPPLPLPSHAMFAPPRRVVTTFPTAAPPSSSSVSTAAPFPPMVRPPTSTAMRAASSRDSRYSTATCSTRSSTATSRSSCSAGTFRRDSHRWSFATTSTEASSLGCASDEQPAKGRSVRFDSVDEADELVSADFARLPTDTQPPVLTTTESAQVGTSRVDGRKRDSCGLISWQDFAHELEDVAPSPATRPPGTSTTAPRPLPRGAAFPAHLSAVSPFASRPPAKHYSRAAHPPIPPRSADRLQPGTNADRRTTTYRLGRGLVRRGFGAAV